jgi:hypothetical protein
LEKKADTSQGKDAEASRLGESFDVMSKIYDNIRFVQFPAARLVELVKIQPGYRVLDIAGRISRDF